MLESNSISMKRDATEIIHCTDLTQGLVLSCWALNGGMSIVIMVEESSGQYVFLSHHPQISRSMETYLEDIATFLNDARTLAMRR